MEVMALAYVYVRVPYSALTLALVICDGPLGTSEASNNIVSILCTASFKFIA